MKTFYTIIFSIFIAMDVYGTMAKLETLTTAFTTKPAQVELTSSFGSLSIKKQLTFDIPSNLKSAVNFSRPETIASLVEDCYNADKIAGDGHYFSECLRTLMSYLYFLRLPDIMTYIDKQIKSTYGNDVQHFCDAYYANSLIAIRELPQVTGSIYNLELY